MKTFRLFICLFTAMSLGLGFTSCSKDDDLVVNEADLVGKWYTVHTEGYEKYADHPDWNEEWNKDVNRGDMYMVLNADHTFQSVETYDGGADTQTGKWSVSGNQLTISITGESPMTMTIKSLSKTEAKIENYDKGTDEDGPYEVYSLITLNR